MSNSNLDTRVPDARSHQLNFLSLRDLWIYATFCPLQLRFFHFSDPLSLCGSLCGLLAVWPFVVINVNAFLFMTCEAAPAGGPIPAAEAAKITGKKLEPTANSKSNLSAKNCKTLRAITSNAAFEWPNLVLSYKNLSILMISLTLRTVISAPAGISGQDSRILFGWLCVNGVFAH